MKMPWQRPGGMLHTRSASNRERWKHEQQEQVFEFMSQHRSLRAAATLGGKRNVMKRFERVELLKKRGQWKEGDRITGLRKTKAAA
jgi:small basic protein (TIGR04137 family)